jgi:translation initiation factor 1 (eIF-1/SUI1)
MDFLNLENKSDKILKELDEKIILHCRQVKGKKKTNVKGLDQILIDDEEMLQMISKIKKQYGCGGILMEDKSMDFNGDQRYSIRDFLLERNLIEKERIVIR